MIIGIDGNEANVEEKVGIGEYAYELLLAFYKLAPQKPDLKFRIYLKEPPRNDMPPPSHYWRYQIIRPKKLWTRIGLPVSLYTEKVKPDVFFSPSHYGPRFSPVKSVISIMDLSYIHFPDLFTKQDLYQLVNWTKISAFKANKIFTISEFSKNDIIKAYKKDKEDVTVTYPGIKAIESRKNNLSMDELKNKFGISKNYILFVGTLQPRKNIQMLIEAFSLIKNDDLNLIIVGKRGWQYGEIYKAPVTYGVSDKVKFLDFVNNEDLPSLYKNAQCFVLPSLYEGFGLPVLEAMKYGCPVLTSNVSSLPEAGGDAAVYFDPNNVTDIKEKIEKVLASKVLREEMIKKGYNQVKKFSWEKTARETLRVLEEVAKK